MGVWSDKLSTGAFDWQVVILLDMLGHSDLIQSLPDHPNQQDEASLKKVLNRGILPLHKFADFVMDVHSSFWKNRPTKNAGGTDIFPFSDTVCLIQSFRAPYNQTAIENLYILLSSLSFAFVSWQSDGIFFRGGIEMGASLSYGDGHLPYGKAVVNAHKLEQEAGYPRILVGKGFKSFLDQLAKDQPNKDTAIGGRIETMLATDGEGRLFLDYLSPNALHDSEAFLKSHPILDGAYKKTEEALTQADSEGRTKHAEKYRLLIAYQDAKRPSLEAFLKRSGPNS